jgi:hypothetical protein
MVLEQRVCPGCGGPVAASTTRCEHCGAWLEDRSEARIGKPASSLKRFFAPLPVDAGEFGMTGSLPLAVGLAVAAVLYALGWALEDTQYWLAPGAVAIWAAALPIMLGLTALLWRTRLTAWFLGLGIALAILALHLAIIWLIRARINDDMFGIASIYATTAFVGWLLGRTAHFALRRRRMRAQGE